MQLYKSYGVYKTKPNTKCTHTYARISFIKKYWMMLQRFENAQVSELEIKKDVYLVQKAEKSTKCVHFT